MRLANEITIWEVQAELRMFNEKPGGSASRVGRETVHPKTELE
jgi:hypothetical protein